MWDQSEHRKHAHWADPRASVGGEWANRGYIRSHNPDGRHRHSRDHSRAKSAWVPVFFSGLLLLGDTSNPSDFMTIARERSALPRQTVTLVPMQIQDTAISDVKLITPRKFGDERGWFSEVWSDKVFADAGLSTTWVQDNHAYSATPGVLRGLHFQKPPYTQAKLVRCTRGAVLDVAVDIRVGSPTYGQYVAAELSAENWAMILVPRGFAHGYCTLVPDTEVLYKVDNLYAPDHDAGLAWDDPKLAIEWPTLDVPFTLSEKDKTHPTLDQLPAYF